MMRRTRIRPVSLKRKSRVGKLGIERLVGKDVGALRICRIVFDDYRCQKCGVMVLLDVEPIHPQSAHMAHIHAKRNGGDSISNVQTLCGDCHHKEHAYGPSGQKPCPAKVRP